MKSRELCDTVERGRLRTGERARYDLCNYLLQNTDVRGRLIHDLLPYKHAKHKENEIQREMSENGVDNVYQRKRRRLNKDDCK